MQNPDTEYERFTQEVFRKLSEYHHFNIRTVQHNIKLKGHSGCEHQIDVYWEYEKDGINHRVAIECKNYNKRVEKEKVCAFQGVLADVDNVKGIMVTKIGFQKGAKTFAKQYDILLKELREPDKGETIIGEIEIHNHIEKGSKRYKVDEKWAEEHRMNIPEYKRNLDLCFAPNDHKWRNATYIPLTIIDDVVRNAKGDYLISLESVEPQIRKRPAKDFPYVLPFEDGYINSKEYGTIKILEVKYDFEREKQQTNFALDAEGFVKAILKDTFSDNTDLVVLR
jgi:hypothetical protein